MQGFLKPYQVEQIKKKYPVGTWIELDDMAGEPDMPGRLRGTVEHVDDQGQLHMKWDNGRTLALVPDEDSFHILRTQETRNSEAQTESQPKMQTEPQPAREIQTDFEPMNRYVDYINANILPAINYERLQNDYDTEEKAYAKSVLNALYQGVLAVYGTEIFDRDTAGGYVLLPGVVQSKAAGQIAIALLELDLQSSGEHCGTDFLIRYGCINQDEPEMPEEVQKFLRDTYGVYEYCYTAKLTDDIHVNKAKLPQEMRELLRDFKEHEFVPCGVRTNLQSEELEQTDGEDFER